MDKELRKGLAIDEYLELIKEDKNLNMAYISLSQYMHLLENQLEEKDKVIDEAIKFIRNGRDGKGQFYKCCERKVSIKEDEELLEILERGTR